jgi:hypothetical protein
LEVLQILLVALDQDLVMSTLKRVSPLSHCLDNREELKIVRVVVLFVWGALSTVEIDLGKNPESGILVEDAGDCEADCIGRQNDRFLWVEMLEDRCFGKGHYELSKCEFGIPSPFPLP